MQRLILFRHGKAEAQSASGGDFDRQLEPRGVREAAAMGRLLAGKALAPDVVLVSAAARRLVEQEGCTTIALAQFSMARAAPMVAAATGRPVLTPVASAVRAMRERCR